MGREGSKSWSQILKMTQNASKRLAKIQKKWVRIFLPKTPGVLYLKQWWSDRVRTGRECLLAPIRTQNQVLVFYFSPATPLQNSKMLFLVAFNAKDVRQNLFWLILWSQKYCQMLVQQDPADHKWKSMAKIGVYNGRSIQLIAFGTIYIMVFPLSTLL